MAASFTASMILQLVDKLSGPARRAIGSVTKDAKKLAALRAGSAAAGQLGRGLSTAGRVGRRALGGLIDVGANFEQTMTRVRSKTLGIAAAQFDRLEQKALELGEQTQFTGIQAAGGLELLAQAGLGAEEQLAAIGPVLNMAAAGNMNLSRSAEIAADVSKEFGLGAEEIGRVADVLTVGSLSATTNIGQLGKGMSKIGPLAKEYGLSLEEAVAFTASFANVGLKGGIGGRAMRTIIKQLVAPSKASAKALDALGASAEDIEAGPIQVFTKIADAQKNLPKVEFLNRLATAFGSFGVAGAGAIAADFAENLGKVDENGEPASEIMKILARGEKAAGEAARVAGEAMATTRGDILKLDAATETASIRFFKAFAPSLRMALQEITKVVSGIGEWAKENPETAKTIMQVVLATTALATVFGPVLIAGASIVSFFTNLAVMSKLAGGAKGLGLVIKSFTVLKNMSLVGGAFAFGVLVGKWLDDTFKLSDAIAGVNQKLTQSKRGAPALLGTLTPEERAQLGAAKTARETALEERRTGFLASIGASESDLDILTDTDERINAANAEIDRLNALGRERQAGIKSEVALAVKLEPGLALGGVESSNADVTTQVDAGLQQGV